MDIKKLKISELKISNNERAISDESFEKLKRSLDLNGNLGIIIIDEENNVLSGNQRVKALKEIKGDEYVVPVMVYAGENKDFVKVVSNISYGDFNLDELNLILKNIDDEYINLIDFNADVKNALNSIYFNDDVEEFIENSTHKDIQKLTKDNDYNPDYSIERDERSIFFLICDKESFKKLNEIKKTHSDSEIVNYLIDYFK